MTTGPAAAVLGGHKGASVKVLLRLRGEGSETNPTRHSDALCACDAVRALTCPPAQRRACAKPTLIPLGPVLQWSWVSSF